MTKVEIFKDQKGNIIRYRVMDHTGYAEEGEDIVCAAVSVLAQTTLMSLVDVVGISEDEIEFHIDEEVPILDVKLPNINYFTNKKAQILLESFELGINKIIESYGKYVTLRYREV